MVYHIPLFNAIEARVLATATDRETLNKSFDRACPELVEGLRTNGKLLIPFVVMLSLTKHRTMSGIHLFSVSLIYSQGLSEQT